MIALDCNLRPAMVGELHSWRQRIEAFARCASIIKLSDEDFASGWGESAEPDEQAARWLEHGAKLVVMTHGARGVTAWFGSGRMSVPAVTVDVVDTVGAGDSFQAALLARLSQNGFVKLARVSDARLCLDPGRPALCELRCQRDLLEARCRPASARGSESMTHPIRLNRRTLVQLPKAIGRPAFDPANVRAGIVHLGLGGFHRAHMARYTHDLMNERPDSVQWGIVGVGLLPADERMHESLAPSGCSVHLGGTSGFR